MPVKKKSSSGNSSCRTRNWATVVYPESAPEGWQGILSDFKIPAFISPLHDLDVNPTGEVKKEHYHVLIMFDNVKTADQAVEIFDAIGGVGHERVNSIRGMARYLCHLDNPEKHQYCSTDVISLSGADYFSVISLPTDRYTAIREMIQYCRENNVYSYCNLFEYAEANREDWFVALCENATYVMKEYLKSKSWTMNLTKDDVSDEF